MELESLEEYIKSRPIENDRSIPNIRGCSICHAFHHYKNMAFIMGTEASHGFGSVSWAFCLKCLPKWRQLFDVHRAASSPDGWVFSTWDLDKPVPHHEVDRIFLYLKHGQFYLQTDFNPSKRIVSATKEEGRI